MARTVDSGDRMVVIGEGGDFTAALAFLLQDHHLFRLHRHLLQLFTHDSGENSAWSLDQ